MEIKPIETHYAGCRFRSRLEARWVVFFEKLGIRWEYEPQGFVIGGRPYLPDFRLLDSGTWIEVKGQESDLDHDLMLAATLELPEARAGFPTLLMLGPIPDPPTGTVPSLGWIGLSPAEGESYDDDGERIVLDGYWAFTPPPFPGHPLRRADTSCATPVMWGDEGWLEPGGDMTTTVPAAKRHLEPDAYRAARSARFEHGEKP